MSRTVSSCRPWYHSQVAGVAATYLQALTVAGLVGDVCLALFEDDDAKLEDAELDDAPAAPFVVAGHTNVHSVMAARPEAIVSDA